MQHHSAPRLRHRRLATAKQHRFVSDFRDRVKREKIGVAALNHVLSSQIDLERRVTFGGYAAE